MTPKNPSPTPLASRIRAAVRAASKRGAIAPRAAKGMRIFAKLVARLETGPYATASWEEAAIGVAEFERLIARYPLTSDSESDSMADESCPIQRLFRALDAHPLELRAIELGMHFEIERCCGGFWVEYRDEETGEFFGDHIAPADGETPLACLDRIAADAWSRLEDWRGSGPRAKALN